MAIQDGVASLSFDGVDDYCTIPNSDEQSVAFRSGYVMFGKIKPKNAGENNEGRIFDKDSKFGLSVRTQNRLGIAMVGTGSVIYSADNSVPNNVWTQFIVNVDPNGISTFYINGVLSGTPGDAGAPASINGNNAILVGNRLSNDRTFNGNMKDLGILSLAGRGNLTQQEVEDLAYYGKIPTGALIVNLPVNEGAGTIISDTSGNGNDGTIVGATWSAEVPPYMIRGGNLPEINANMVKNGDFSIVPPAGVPTTVTDRFIDGTSSGSANEETGKIFNARLASTSLAGGGVGISAQFTEIDGERCIRLISDGKMYKAGSTTTLVEITFATQYHGSVISETNRKFLIKVRPNTSYTYTVRYRVDSITANEQVVIGYIQYLSNLVRLTGSVTILENIGVVTNGWVTKKVTFTTASTTEYISAMFAGNAAGVDHIDGSCDIAVASIFLSPTTPTELVAIS